MKKKTQRTITKPKKSAIQPGVLRVIELAAQINWATARFVETGHTVSDAAKLERFVSIRFTRLQIALDRACDLADEIREGSGEKRGKAKGKAKGKVMCKGKAKAKRKTRK